MGWMTRASPPPWVGFCVAPSIWGQCLVGISDFGLLSPGEFGAGNTGEDATGVSDRGSRITSSEINVRRRHQIGSEIPLERGIFTNIDAATRLYFVERTAQR